ncbi:MAG: hypothetical protein EOO40_04795 [Deltaproteobacteria bacterium]|nr:MAG: hypothetical protein EOO40_04795 [Deltaproteobacteria bacterium]
MARSERGGFMRAVGVVLVGLLICGLLALVAYQQCFINERHFRTSQVGDKLVVEQGRFFPPIGFTPFHGDTEALQQAYADIPLPPQENVGQSIVFDERTALDRALFTLLSGWASTRMDAADDATLALAQRYVQRAENLPGISEGQRQQLRALRADAALRKGQNLVATIGTQLHAAQSQFQLALDLGTPHSAAARAGLESAQDKLRRLGLSPDAPVLPAGGGAPP